MGNTLFSSKKPEYETFASKNPYATAFMSKFGSAYRLNPFLEAQNRLIEQNVPKLYNQLLNPLAETQASKAQTRAFENALKVQSQSSFENDIINPLSERRMLRSSLLNDLVNNLQQTQTTQIANFKNEQLSNTSKEVQNLINFFMNQYKSNSGFGEKTLKDAMTGGTALNSYITNMNKQSSSNGIDFEKIGESLAAVATVAAMCFA